MSLVNEVLSSPTLSSTSSFEMMSSVSSPAYDSDDEIVWGLSSSAISTESSLSRNTQSDFIVLSRALSPSSQPPPESSSGDITDSVSDISSSIASITSSDALSSASLSSSSHTGSKLGRKASVAKTPQHASTPSLHPLMPSRVLNVDYPTPTPTPKPGASQLKKSVAPVKSAPDLQKQAANAAKIASEAKILAQKATAKAQTARARAQATSGKSQAQITEDQRSAEKASKKAKTARKRARKAEKKAKAAKASVASCKPPVVANIKRAASPKTPTVPVVGLGSRPVVDDSVSEVASEKGDELSTYAEASEFITSFINDPEAAQTKSKVHRLALIQSLLIELGVSTTSLLPRTITAAKALVKSTVFINIREYLNTRSQGQDALKQILLPSRKALIKNIRATGPTPRQFVKDHGLQALLVHC